MYDVRSYDLKSWMHDWLRLQKGYVPITIIKGFKTTILMLFIITSKLDPFVGRCYSRPRISVRFIGLGPAYLFGNLYIVPIYYDIMTVKTQKDFKYANYTQNRKRLVLYFLWSGTQWYTNISKFAYNTNICVYSTAVCICARFR